MSLKGKNKLKVIREHSHFISVLVLFVAFSSFAIFTFFGSNEKYIKNFYASAIQGVLVEEDIPAPKQNPFTDLDVNHKNANAIISLYYDGIIKGHPDGSYKPDTNVTRAEFAKILIEAVDFDYTSMDPAALSNCFSDVKDLTDHWFAPFVCSAKHNGWIKGFDGNKYNPGQNITRAEAFKIVLGAFGLEIPENESVEKSQFVDVDNSSWYLGVAEASIQNKLIDDDANFYPNRIVTRAEVAQIIYNALSLKK